MTWDVLLGLWDERDHRYRRRRSNLAPLQMSPEEARAVRDYRRAEIAMLPQAARAMAHIALNLWAPPVAVWGMTA